MNRRPGSFRPKSANALSDKTGSGLVAITESSYLERC